MSEPSPPRLSTWDDLARHAQRAHGAVATEAGELRVAVEGAPAPVELRPVDVHGARWVEVVAVLASRLRSVPPTPILTRNFLLPIGHIGMLDGNLMLRQLLPIDGLATADLDDVLAFIAQAMHEAQAS